MKREHIIAALEHIAAAIDTVVSDMARVNNARHLASLSGQLDQLDTGELRLRSLLQDTASDAVL